MAASELKQKMLLNELAKIGFPDAEYVPESGKIKIQPNNSRMPSINDAGDIHYGTEYDSFVTNTLKPLVDMVNEVCAAWEKAQSVPFENLSHFRILAEYNSVIMAAEEDTKSELRFVTWQYNRERTGLDHGHYTEDFNAAKEDFAVRAGLMSKDKLLTQEQAAELTAAVEYRLENDNDFYLTYAKETALKEIVVKLRTAYPEKVENVENAEAEKTAAVNTKAEAKTLGEKLGAAKEKAKMQEAQGGKTKSKKRDERE